jgi:hypothetical protein
MARAATTRMPMGKAGMTSKATRQRPPPHPQPPDPPAVGPAGRDVSRRNPPRPAKSAPSPITPRSGTGPITQN